MEQSRWGHPKGKCPAGDWYDWCDGIEWWEPNAFDIEINDDDTPDWYCEGIQSRLADEI